MLEWYPSMGDNKKENDVDDSFDSETMRHHVTREFNRYMSNNFKKKIDSDIMEGVRSAGSLD